MRTTRRALLAFVASLALAEAALCQGVWVEVSGGTWWPSPAMIANLQSGISEYVITTSQVQGRKLKEWSTYSFQYRAETINGHSVIFVNAFCTSPPEHPEREFLAVFDGGSCFFNLKYSPEKSLFYDLAINGEA